MNDRGYLAVGAMGGGLLALGLGLRWLGEGVGTLWLAQWALFTVVGFGGYVSERARNIGSWILNMWPVQAAMVLLTLTVTGFCCLALYLAVTAADPGPGTVVNVPFYGFLGAYGVWITVVLGRELLSRGTD